MLGVMRPEQLWGWAAYGKHPAAKDFFRIGQDMPLLKGFSEWIEKGYREATTNNSIGKSPLSWRFWAKGVRKGVLVCGLIKDSSDSLGRSYPLLIMGSGPLQDWENRWDLLPLACEKTWGEIEFISSRMFEDFERLKATIHAMRPPQPHWADFEEKRNTDAGTDKKSGYYPSARDDDKLERQISLVSNKTEMIIDLDQKPFPDQFAAVNCMQALLKIHDKHAPHAMFVGGAVDRSFLALFKRPLSTDDFVKLWSMTTAE